MMSQQTPNRSNLILRALRSGTSAFWLAALGLCAALPATALAAGAARYAEAAEEREAPMSEPARKTLDWIQSSGDNEGMPVVIVDKARATVLVFDAQLRVVGASPALLGLSIGDTSIPGIGSKKLSEIAPHERTTPAGRYKAEMGVGMKGENLLWVDYDGGVALHRMVPGTPAEQRARRMASPDPKQRRVTFGCINVPVRFFEAVVAPALSAGWAMVYVLPETRAGGAAFGPGSPEL